MNNKTNAIVMLSGEGTTFQSLVDKCKYVNVVGVISSNPDANGIARAHKAGIPFKVVNQTSSNFNNDLIQSVSKLVISNEYTKFIVLAGFMKILPPTFIKFCSDAGIDIINIHPSLLPNHKGLNTHKRVLDSGDTVHGMTIHYVTDKLDDGPIIYQNSFPVRETDTEKSLNTQVKYMEQLYYPKVLDDIAIGSMTLYSPQQ
jgi:phosphoribosylglycinamide formyltransferase-1